MNSIFAALSEEIDHPELSEYIIEAEYDFAKGAFKTGMSNLKAIREMFVQENIPKNLIEALDAFIKAINGKKFEDTKTSRKTIEKIMKMIYPVSEEENSEEDSEEDDSCNEDTEKEDSEEDDSDEEMLDLEDAIEKYNKLLKNKVLNKYIVAKRFKITNDIDEDEEKREMIYALYKVIKNIYENFSSEKDAGDILDVLEELDEITDMI